MPSNNSDLEKRLWEAAEVDHILPYSKGGKTTIDNAQLALRYFNRTKNNKIE